jgi:tetratricopeptide (TPR) repeat protein
VKSFVQQHHYRKAIDEIKRAKQAQPNLTLQPSEAELWMLQGQHEFEKGEYRQSENSLNQSLKLGQTGAVYYWLAKCLLAVNRLDAALEKIRVAFEQDKLSKDFNITYAKLLLLKGDTAAVEDLLQRQAKRFPAAHQHWLRGVLALKAEQFQEARSCFNKVKAPILPSDRPDIWQIYTDQLLGNWQNTARELGLGRPQSLSLSFMTLPRYTRHPLLFRLALFQLTQAITMGEGQENNDWLDGFLMPNKDLKGYQDIKIYEELVEVISMLDLIDRGDFHEAGHALLRLSTRSSRFPELATLRADLLTLSGQQAFQQNAMACAAALWQPLISEQRDPAKLNPQLAVNLVEVFKNLDDEQELQRLLTRLLRWLDAIARNLPEGWTTDRLKQVQAEAHCLLSDVYMVMGRTRAAIAEVDTAERLCPGLAEVIGRRGLMAWFERRLEAAASLLTQALEQGCTFEPVYFSLIKVWQNLDQPDKAQEVRRRFGKQFDDLNPASEIEFPLWSQALLTHDYATFKALLSDIQDHSPVIQACQILINSVQGAMTSGGKVAINQAKATQDWNKLLDTLSPQEQVTPLFAIALSLLLFAKREKGIVALINQYRLKLFDWADQNLEAAANHLVVLVLKERDRKKVEPSLREYLARSPQPGNALAQAQLQVRRYSSTAAQAQFLLSDLEAALTREPQNPLLLLAKATCYPADSDRYETFRKQGFEIARRIQDEKALQAFREEDSFLDLLAVQEVLPDPEDLFNGNALDPMALDRMFEQIITQKLGNQVPPSELRRMMPELKQMMMNSMSRMAALEGLDDLFDEDDEDDEDGNPFFMGGFNPFGFNPGGASKRKRRR